MFAHTKEEIGARQEHTKHKALGLGCTSKLAAMSNLGPVHKAGRAAARKASGTMFYILIPAKLRVCPDHDACSSEC